MTEQPARQQCRRLDLPSLRGEITTMAQHLADEPVTPREQALLSLCASLDEAARILRETLDDDIETRAAKVAELETASEQLFRFEVGQ